MFRNKTYQYKSTKQEKAELYKKQLIKLGYNAVMNPETIDGEKYFVVYKK